MKKIVIKENYEIEYSDTLDEKVAKKMLKRATTYYSGDRLAFKDTDKYKTFTFMNNNAKYKIVVAKSEEDLEKNIKEIVNTIGTNTALFMNLDSYDSKMYYKIIDKKNDFLNSFYSKKRIISLFLLNILTIIIEYRIGLHSSIIADIAAKLFVGAIPFAILADDKFSIKRHPFASSMLAGVFLGLPWVVDLLITPVMMKINNIIGDIKNETFSFKKSFRKFVEKYIKKPLTKLNKKIHSYDEEITEVTNSLDKDTINPSIYMLNVTKNANTSKEKISIHDFSKYLRDLIGKLSPYDSQRFASKLDDILDKYTTKEIVQSDLVHNEVVSQLMTLNDEIDCFLLLNQNNTDTIDELLDASKQNVLTR